MKFVISAVFICLCVGFINVNADNNNLAKQLKDQYVDEVIASVLDNSTDPSEINNDDTVPEPQVDISTDINNNETEPQADDETGIVETPEVNSNATEPQEQTELPDETKTEQKKPEVSVKDKYKKVMEEAREGELYYDYIWRFMELVNNLTDFNMINPVLTPFDEYFKRPENETHLNDLQIFYEGSLNHIGGGHYICAYYDAKLKTVFVYDSLKFGYLHPRTKKLIEIRYLKAKVSFIKPKTKQPDGVSCGIFSTAYATAIIFGKDPAKVPFKIDHREKNKSISLRRHMAKILAHNRLKMFPTK